VFKPLVEPVPGSWPAARSWWWSSFQFDQAAACSGGVALALQLPFWVAACVAVLTLVAISAATHDIAADGLYIASLSDEKDQAALRRLDRAPSSTPAKLHVARPGLLLLAGYFEKTMASPPCVDHHLLHPRGDDGRAGAVQQLGAAAGTRNAVSQRHELPRHRGARCGK
jgi:hypothetical protein